MWSGVKPFCTQKTRKERKKSVNVKSVLELTLHSHKNICDSAAAFIRMIRGSKWSARKWMGGAENCQLQTTRVTKKALFYLSILLPLKSRFLESAFLAPCVSLISTLQNSTFVPPLLSFVPGEMWHLSLLTLLSNQPTSYWMTHCLPTIYETSSYTTRSHILQWWVSIFSIHLVHYFIFLHEDTIKHL